MRLRFVIPQTPNELLTHASAIYFLAQFLPDWSDADWQTIVESVPTIVLVYTDPGKGVQPVPLAMGQYHPLSENPRGCEIHGVIRQDLRKTLPRHNYLSRTITDAFLSLLFEQFEMDFVCVSSLSNNVFVRGFKLRYPFKKQALPSHSLVPEKDHYHVLTRESFRRLSPL